MTMLLNPFWAAASSGGIVTDGLEFDLNVAVYSSGQIWANDVASPASGANRSAYDFYLGGDVSASTVDPTYNAGPPANFSTDGNDYFTVVSGVTTFINRIAWGGAGGGKTITLMAAIYVVPSAGAVMATTNAGGLDTGFEWLAGTTQSFWRLIDAGTVFTAVPSTLLNSSAWNIIGLSFTEAASTSFQYLNGNYNQVSGSNTFTLTNTVPTNANAAGLNIFSRPNLVNIMPNGTMIGRLICWNRPLTKTEMDQNFTALRGYYGI